MKRLVLVGGGHAHLKVLAALARQRLPGWHATLVSSQPHQLYSGVLPGWIAGHYPLDAAMIPLLPLAQRAGADFQETTASGLDLAGGKLRCAEGRDIGFDAVSLDVGPSPPLDRIEVDSEMAFPVRPLGGLVEAWPRVMREIASRRGPYHLVMLGAGAGGLELAFAVRHRAVREGWSHLEVTLAGSEALPLAGAPEAARRRAMALLHRHCIEWRGGHRATAVRGNAIAFAGQDTVHADSCWIATGADAPAWIADSGLALDAAGFVRVGPTLQSVSHPHVFAAGDVAAHPSAVPKSGVYAVRAGAVLAANLRAFCTGSPLQDWRPQRRALYLIGTGAREALGTWGDWCLHGRLAWHWKDRIDRGFVRSYAG